MENQITSIMQMASYKTANSEVVANHSSLLRHQQGQHHHLKVLPADFLISLADGSVEDVFVRFDQVVPLLLHGVRCHIIALLVHLVGDVQEGVALLGHHPTYVAVLVDEEVSHLGIPGSCKERGGDGRGMEHSHNE